MPLPTIQISRSLFPILEMDASQLEAASPPRVPSPPPLIPKSPLPLRTLPKFFGKAPFNLRDSDITAGVDRIFDRTIGTGAEAANARPETFLAEEMREMEGRRAHARHAHPNALEQSADDATASRESQPA